ncbi:MAG: hypothetical protein AUJ85_00700 [Elusimicrobia bacterium CG1_02_37_114]|nr:MAG: hypothetical protein AUJ85_00700 [Elusimicrobia bacterium CG1_02_37_114]PIV53000.1 MAG: hypothetical protein COS17_06270 [Elusimicrobia bacterium CG02_land_8_20_14_3_00_37_13]PIZ14312.1 MAG: hypothetical protein COY53_00360 [Elusimicrobia bacterium CG_4_10_14_0_8_um_filter_37_32]
MSKVLVFSGANGTGKTTLAKSILEHNIQFINADDIKKTENLSYIEAGQKSLKMIDLCISQNKDFSFETTMSGKGLLKRFEYLKKEQYRITIYYLFAYPIELLLERIKERVKKGGHFVSDIDVERRYRRSIQNFWTCYRFFADEWTIINNNELEPKNIVAGNKKELYIIDNSEFDVFKEVLRNV